MPSTQTLYIIISCLAVWALISSIIALSCKFQNNKLKTCEDNLNKSERDVDNCRSFCGSKGNWSSGQIRNFTEGLNTYINTKHVLMCDTPVNLSSIISCAVKTLSSNYAYWEVFPAQQIGYETALLYINTTLKTCTYANPSCKWTL